MIVDATRTEDRQGGDGKVRDACLRQLSDKGSAKVTDSAASRKTPFPRRFVFIVGCHQPYLAIGLKVVIDNPQPGPSPLAPPGVRPAHLFSRVARWRIRRIHAVSRAFQNFDWA